MKELKFETNINCGSCIRTVSSVFDNESKIGKWEVDLMDEKKPLSVMTELSEQEVIKNLESVGFKAEAKQ